MERLTQLTDKRLKIEAKIIQINNQITLIGQNNEKIDELKNTLISYALEGLKLKQAEEHIKNQIQMDNQSSNSTQPKSIMPSPLKSIETDPYDNNDFNFENTNVEDWCKLFQPETGTEQIGDQQPELPSFHETQTKTHEDEIETWECVELSSGQVVASSPKHCPRDNDEDSSNKKPNSEEEQLMPEQINDNKSNKNSNPQAYPWFSNANDESDKVIDWDKIEYVSLSDPNIVLQRFVQLTDIPDLANNSQNLMSKELYQK